MLGPGAYVIYTHNDLGGVDINVPAGDTKLPNNTREANNLFFISDMRQSSAIQTKI
jgi:hypothetical protein